VIGAALVGRDWIDDVDVLRAGATPELFGDVCALSTVGSWLRSFTWGGVRQLGAVSRTLLVGVWQAGLAPSLKTDLTIDVDSAVVETYGLVKTRRLAVFLSARVGLSLADRITSRYRRAGPEPATRRHRSDGSRLTVTQGSTLRPV
jgi:hypothetical protein